MKEMKIPTKLIMAAFIALHRHNKKLLVTAFGRGVSGNNCAHVHHLRIKWQHAVVPTILTKRTQSHRSFHTTLLFSSSNEAVSSTSEKQDIYAVDSLADLLRTSYDIGETDAIQDVLTSNCILPLLLGSPEFPTTEQVSSHLIESAIKAASMDTGLNRGALSGMMNAILASCCSTNETPEEPKDMSIQFKYPELALSILQQMDDLHSKDENVMVTPDLVTLSMVYYSFHVAQQQSLFRENNVESSDWYNEIQSKILERAQKLAKKTAGSSRRKSLAAERRRKPSTPSNNLTMDLQSLYGPDIAILYEDDYLIALSKPTGMVCYHNKKTSAGKLTTSRKKKSRNNDNKDEAFGTKTVDISLVDALLDMSVPLSTLNPSARGIVHRLDRGTSGTILLAKNDEMHMRLVALFFLRRVQKKYLALVPARPSDGDMDLSSDGEIDSIVDGRPAVSKYKIVSLFTDPSQAEHDPIAMLLEVQTLTGRKHQVRVHCADGLQRPIFLDSLYSESSKRPLPKSRDKKNKQNKDAEVEDTIPAAVRQAASTKEHFFLHASTISIDELGVHSDAVIPKWWQDVLDKWDVVQPKD
jgi:23S rRNA-/tRNA-specific pseudouridylate synthase